ncbi:MAG: acyloxyacyl hydrolase [Planctomycetota bacterium]
MVPSCGMVCAIVGLGSTPTVQGDADLRNRVSLDIHFATALVQADQTPPAELPVRQVVSTAPAFGEKDSWRWYLTAGYGQEVNSSHDEFVIFGGGVSFFMVDNLSLNFELNGLYWDQESSTGFPDAHDAWGVNFNVLVRWHFLARETWSIYCDGGVGVMGTTERVPGPDRDESDGGSYFNFTPQIGAGASVEVGPRTRLLTGVRWHHVSNARSSNNNPGRDSLMVYAGVSFAF